MDHAIEPFVVDVPQTVLDDLRDRIARTRWPDEVDGAGWDYGANLSYMRELAGYWASGFDWRAQERAMNALPHFRTRIDGHGIHFVHARGRGPAPIPLLILHGWPSSFVEMLELIPRLADPARHGADAADAFDVVVPSVPGFGFSDRPGRGMTRSRVGGLLAQLRERLGYARYAVHGHDIGAVIGGWMAVDVPARMIALHTLMPTFPSPVIGPEARPLTEAERAFETVQRRWQEAEGGYNLIQETRPQTLAYGLNDSPVGLAAWIVEKWRAWTDPDGDVDRTIGRDLLLANVTLYWVTGTANSANRSYFERAREPRRVTERIAVPTGVALTTEPVQRPPRERAERGYADIRRWVDLPRGGHFAAAEAPDALAEELRVFFRAFRAPGRG